MFSYILKGKKKNYDSFFIKDFKFLNNLEVLEIRENKIENEFFLFNKIKYFFDTNSPLFDKTKLFLDIELSTSPEKLSYGIFDFSKKIDMYYSMSMLSKRVTNDNLIIKLNSLKNTSSDEIINHFLRYCLLIYSSRKVDGLFIEGFDNKLTPVFDLMVKFLENSEIIKISNSKDLYVITCKKDKKKFDIIWLGTNREIELTDFKKVYDKFGNLLTKDIKITQSPIYAFHE
jgi:hypothetical protein